MIPTVLGDRKGEAWHAHVEALAGRGRAIAVRSLGNAGVLAKWSSVSLRLLHGKACGMSKTEEHTTLNVSTLPPERLAELLQMLRSLGPRSDLCKLLVHSFGFKTRDEFLFACVEALVEKSSLQLDVTGVEIGKVVGMLYPILDAKGA